jgi:hypothetical protein
MENLAKAIIEVMKEVDGIDKSMTVGSGQSSYKGVPDQEVKKIVRASMIKNGLTLVPTGVEETTEVSRWEETYNGQVKQKQSVFTKVTTKYLLLHTSGESMPVAGYGHGVDSQDKGAGKATTYALKYLLLYLFLIPTGKIDDADATHSDNHEMPKKQAPKKPELKEGTEAFEKAITYIQGGGTIDDIKKKYDVSKVEQLLMDNAI